MEHPGDALRGAGPPAGRGFWSAAFRDGDGALEENRTATDDPVDAAALAEAVEVVPPEVAQRRLEAVQFAQRVFADAPPGTLADQLASTRGLLSHRTLVLTLDRIGLRRPAAYAAALQRARSLDRGVDGTATALASFQGALALVDRARLARVIDAEAAGRLVSSLVSLESSDPGYGCSVARWIEDELLPRFAAGVGSTAAETAERTVARAAAGARLEAAVPEIEWEGFRYRVDVGGAELTRFLEVRNRLGGPSLDDALAFCRAARGLAEAGLADDDPLAHRVERLRAAAGAVGGGRDGLADPRGVAGAFVEAVQRSGARDVERLARPVVAAAGGVLARALACLVYAASLGAPDSTALLGGDPSLRHDFGVDGPGPWSLPEEVRGPEGWRVRGSLLGLDVGLARLALRRLTSELPPLPPGLPVHECLSFAEGVALMDPFELTDEDRDALADSIRRGRERLARFLADGAGLEDEELVRDARLDPVRRNALAWTRLHEPGATEGLFSYDELVRLGRPEPGRRWDAWGAPVLRCEGRMGLRLPVSGSRAEAHSQVPVGQRACYSPDLTLRVALALQELRLPATLAKAVLAYAVQDMIDSLRPAHLEDWSAVTAYARGLSRERIEDYVAALVDGPLTPIETRR